MHDFLNDKNRPITSSVEDLTLFVVDLVSLRVDRHIQELSIAIALSCKGCGLAIGVLDSCTSIKRCSILAHLDVSSPQSKLERL